MKIETTRGCSCLLEEMFMLSDAAEQNHGELMGAGWPMRGTTEWAWAFWGLGSATFASAMREQGEVALAGTVDGDAEVA
uniref:Uncharacterized protein n=1 Tax=Aegilops tauschii subsp. strangulata TaxID=200361 RepID=A0A453T0R6_AEGTS